MVINVNFGDTLPKGIELDVYSMNLNCEATWDMICSGRTKGVFQLESPLGRQWAKKLEPRNIQELGALGALIRPGCLRAMSGNPPKSMTQRYCDRKTRGRRDCISTRIIRANIEKYTGSSNLSGTGYEDSGCSRRIQ